MNLGDWTRRGEEFKTNNAPGQPGFENQNNAVDRSDATREAFVASIMLQFGTSRQHALDEWSRHCNPGNSVFLSRGAAELANEQEIRDGGLPQEFYDVFNGPNS